MAFTAGISNIQVVYPYQLIIGSLALSAENVSAGVSIITDAGQNVTLLDGNNYETSEKVRATAELVGLDSTQRNTLYNILANTSQAIILRLDSNTVYEYISFTAIVLVNKAVKAGFATK